MPLNATTSSAAIDPRTVPDPVATSVGTCAAAGEAARTDATHMNLAGRRMATSKAERKREERRCWAINGVDGARTAADGCRDVQLPRAASGGRACPRPNADSRPNRPRRWRMAGRDMVRRRLVIADQKPTIIADGLHGVGIHRLPRRGQSRRCSRVEDGAAACARSAIVPTRKMLRPAGHRGRRGLEFPRTGIDFRVDRGHFGQKSNALGAAPFMVSTLLTPQGAPWHPRHA